MMVSLGLAFLIVTVSVGGLRWADLGSGLLPRARTDETELIVALVGATIMPHAVVAHSALQSGLPLIPGREHLRMNRWDCGVGFGAAAVINLTMLCLSAVVAAAAQSDHGAIPDVYHGVQRLTGGMTALVLGIGLILSGVASTVVGTYAGQVATYDYVRWRVPAPVRLVVTLAPALVVIAVCSDLSAALVWSQVVISLGIPFTLVPLVLFARSEAIMGTFRAGRFATGVLWLITVVVTVLNGVLVVSTLSGN
jgi:manganese transport protein